MSTGIERIKAMEKMQLLDGEEWESEEGKGSNQLDQLYNDVIGQK